LAFKCTFRKGESMTPTERIEAISKRLRGVPAPRIPRRPDIARKAQQRLRRERIQSEPWEEMILLYHGNLTKISKRMGYDWYRSRRAIWDLGLYPLLVQERGR